MDDFADVIHQARVIAYFPDIDIGCYEVLSRESAYVAVKSKKNAGRRAVMALTAAGAESENFWILHSILNRMSFGQVITDITLILRKDLMMELNTPRLTLTPVTSDDWPFFLQLRQDETLMKFMSAMMTEEENRAVFARRLQGFVPGVRHQAEFIIRDRETGKPQGNIGFRAEDDDMAKVEIGYTLAPYAQGKGYAGEALQALCDFALSSGVIHRLKAAVLAGNVSSARLLEKNGFILHETLKGGYLLNGEHHDDCIYYLEK